jgi:hypothetical protein
VAYVEYSNETPPILDLAYRQVRLTRPLVGQSQALLRDKTSAALTNGRLPELMNGVHITRGG